MAKRLTKIYTRTGDRGMTRLASGDAVAKTSTRVRTCGDLDETNSAIGVLLSFGVPDAVRATLRSGSLRRSHVAAALGT